MEYLSIADFAAESGRSLQAIYKAVKPGGKLYPYIKTENGKTVISREALSLYNNPSEPAKTVKPIKPEMKQSEPEIQPDPEPVTRELNKGLTAEQEDMPAHQDAEPAQEPPLPPMAKEYICFLRRTCNTQAAEIERLQSLVAQKDAQIAAQQEQLTDLSNKITGVALQAVIRNQDPARLQPPRGFFARFLGRGKYQN